MSIIGIDLGPINVRVEKVISNNIETDLGSGLVLNNKICSGRNYSAGEFG